MASEAEATNDSQATLATGDQGPHRHQPPPRPQRQAVQFIATRPADGFPCRFCPLKGLRQEISRAPEGEVVPFLSQRRKIVRGAYDCDFGALHEVRKTRKVQPLKK